MTAIGFTSGTFVRRTGDTMTGDLNLAGATTDLSVDGQILGDFQAVTNIDVMQLLAIGQSTSVISGGDMSPNANPALIDISALTGYIVTYNSSAPLSGTNPSLVYLSVPAQVGLAPAFNPSFFLVDNVGTYVQQATTPTPTQRRTHLFVGVTAQVGGVIVVDQTLPVIPSQVNNQLVDLMGALKPFPTNGNVLSANGVNLFFDKTMGGIFARAFSQVPTPQDPHNAVLAVQTPVQFRHITSALGFFGPLTSTLDVGNYDPLASGVITPIPGGANTTTNFRVIGLANNTVTEQVLVQYGQRTYASLSAAVAALGSGLFVSNLVFDGGAFLGWISVVKSATDLSSPTQAIFTKASKFATP